MRITNSTQMKSPTAFKGSWLTSTTFKYHASFLKKSLKRSKFCKEQALRKRKKKSL